MAEGIENSVALWKTEEDISRSEIPLIDPGSTLWPNQKSKTVTGLIFYIPYLAIIATRHLPAKPV